MADLPTNLKDDILNSSVNTRRKYRMIENGDGTYSFEDLTEYNQVGDEYGAGLINETNRQVNERVEKAVIVRDLETIGAITQEGFIPDALALKDVNDSLQADNGQSFQFAYDSASGKYGYKAEVEGADTFFPFKAGIEKSTALMNGTNAGAKYNTYTFTEDCDMCLAIGCGARDKNNASTSITVNSSTAKTITIMGSKYSSDSFSTSASASIISGLKAGDRVTIYTHYFNVYGLFKLE